MFLTIPSQRSHLSAAVLWRSLPGVIEIAQHKPVVIEVEQGVEHGTNIAAGVLSDILAKYPADEAFVPQALDDPFMLLYSSGTTGHPKGILLSNRNQFSVCKDIARFGVNLP